MGIMEKKMDTTIVFWGLHGDNGKENGYYYSILGLRWGVMEKKMDTTIVFWGLHGDNGKENGYYYSILGFRWG